MSVLLSIFRTGFYLLLWLLVFLFDNLALHRRTVYEFSL